MTLVAKACELYLFDVHLYLAPLTRKDLFQKPFDQLSDPESFNRAYEAGSVLETGTAPGSFRVRPMSREEVEENHFWSHLGQRDEPETPWEKQLPFLHEVEPDLVRFSFGELKAPVQTSILVWPWGWSSNLVVSLEASLTAADLTELVASQLSDNDRKNFRLGDKDAKCTTVFKELAERVKSGLYGEGNGPRSSPPLPRYFVLSIPEVSGEPQTYDRGATPMNGKQRAEIHSILLGSTIDIPTLDDREGRDPRPFLLSNLTGVGFTITDFAQRGTVIYQPDLMARGEHKESKAKHCFSSNVRTAVLTALALAYVIQGVDELEDASPELRGLAKSARLILRSLAKAPNRFHKDFVRMHGTTKPYLSTPTP